MFNMMTTIIPQIFTKLTDYRTPTRTFYATKLRHPTRRYVCCHHRQSFRFGFESSGKYLLVEDRFDNKITKKKKVVLVRFNNLGVGGAGGGGGGRDDGGTARVLGNLALAIGLTYLSMTGQLGWILDAIVSVWVCVSLSVSLFPKLSPFQKGQKSCILASNLVIICFGYGKIDIRIKPYKKYYDPMCDLEVIISYGITFDWVESLENSNYLILIITIVDECYPNYRN